MKARIVQPYCILVGIFLASLKIWGYFVLGLLPVCLFKVRWIFLHRNLENTLRCHWNNSLSDYKRKGR